MATRNPVRVLPEPVGEATSTSRPWAMWGQAPVWGGVGPAGKRRVNQLATAGWNSDSGVASGILLFHQDVVTVASAAGGDAGDRPAEAAVLIRRPASSPSTRPWAAGSGRGGRTRRWP